MNEPSRLSRDNDGPRDGPGEGYGERVVSGDRWRRVVDITDHARGGFIIERKGGKPSQSLAVGRLADRLDRTVAFSGPQFNPQLKVESGYCGAVLTLRMGCSSTTFR